MTPHTYFCDTHSAARRFRQRVGGLWNQFGLSGLNFFTAAVQAGFGPFIAVWLTQQGWTETALGLALSVGTFAVLVGQLPGVMLVDQAHARRTVATILLLTLGSCVTVPLIAALTLAICGHEGLSERLGHNTRYAALGNAAPAAVLGGFH